MDGGGVKAGYVEGRRGQSDKWKRRINRERWLLEDQWKAETLKVSLWKENMMKRQQKEKLEWIDE